MSVDKKQLILLFSGAGTSLIALPIALYGVWNTKPLIVGIADIIMFIAFVQLLVCNSIKE